MVYLRFVSGCLLHYCMISMSCCPYNKYFASSCAPTGPDDSLACCLHYVVKIRMQFSLPKRHVKFAMTLKVCEIYNIMHSFRKRNSFNFESYL